MPLGEIMQAVGVETPTSTNGLGNGVVHAAGRRHAG
jgi:hypothetical protein